MGALSTTARRSAARCDRSPPPAITARTSPGPLAGTPGYAVTLAALAQGVPANDPSTESRPEVRRLPGRKRHFVRRETRRAVRLPRAERRRQDDHDQDA